MVLNLHRILTNSKLRLVGLVRKITFRVLANGVKEAKHLNNAFYILKNNCTVFINISKIMFLISKLNNYTIFHIFYTAYILY